MKCLNISDLVRLFSYPQNTDHSDELKQHLSSCSKCQSIINSYLKSRKWLLKYKSDFSKATKTDKCLSPAGLLDYLENKTRKNEIRHIQNHLADCSSCLDELVQLENFLVEIGKTGEEISPGLKTSQVIYRLPQFARDLMSLGYRWRVAAVAFVIIFISTIIFTITDTQKMITRDQDNNLSAPGIDSLYPQEDAIIDNKEMYFRWRGPRNVIYYTFILLDDEGDILLENQLDQTKIKIPDNINLTAKQNYFWQVSAKMPDGTGYYFNDVSILLPT